MFPSPQISRKMFRVGAAGSWHEQIVMRGKFFLLMTALSLFSEPSLAHDEGQLYRLVPGLSILTSFAHDFGDSISKVTYQGVDYEPGEASVKILPLVNWPDRADKLQLGIAWARVFGLQGCEVLSEGHYMHRPEHPEPVAEFMPDGTFRYTAMVVNLRGRNPGGIFQRVIEIAPSGELTASPMRERTP